MYWRVKYLANRSVIVVGITLIWQKAETAIYTYNSYETILVLFKFGGCTKNRQIKITAK